MMIKYQFPARPAFAINIHEDQGRTFEFVGVEQQSAFMHRTLYVALSRIKRRNSLKVRTENPRHTHNVIGK